MGKKTRSQEFRRSKHRVIIAADWAPAELKREALAKCKREKTSLRSVILRLLTAWVKRPDRRAA